MRVASWKPETAHSNFPEFDVFCVEIFFTNGSAHGLDHDRFTFGRA
jgi:hypothetical protein